MEQGLSFRTTQNYTFHFPEWWLSASTYVAVWCIHFIIGVFTVCTDETQKRSQVDQNEVTQDDQKELPQEDSKEVPKDDPKEVCHYVSHYN